MTKLTLQRTLFKVAITRIAFIGLPPISLAFPFLAEYYYVSEIEWIAYRYNHIRAKYTYCIYSRNH